MHWFGGEPLLAPEVITFITNTLDEKLSKKGIKITYNMTTNGSLITKEIVDAFKNDCIITDEGYIIPNFNCLDNDK